MITGKPEGVRRYKWTEQLGTVEIAQLKLMYAAVYQVLGLVELPFEDNLSEKLVKNLFDNQITSFSVNKRFPVFKKVCSALKKSIRKVPLEDAVAKFQWLTRSNGDKFIARFIRQEVNTLKAITSLGACICWHALKYDMEGFLAAGSSFFSGDWGFNTMNRMPPRYIAGHDIAGRPLVVAQGDQYPRWFDSESVKRWNAVFNEQVQLLTQDHTDGATVVFDITNFPDCANIESCVIRFIGDCFSQEYPMLVSRIFIHNAPKTVQKTAWKLVAPMMKPRFRNRVNFTYRTPQLLDYISLDQLPKSLGGYSNYNYIWREPVEELPPMIPEELLQRQEECRDQLQAATLGWIVAATDQEEILEDRYNMLRDQESIFWEMDWYTRRRTMLDDDGLTGRLRPEIIGKPPRAASYISEDYESSHDHVSQFTYDNSSFFSSLEMMSINTSRDSKASAARSTTSSTKKVSTVFSRLTRNVSMSTFGRKSLATHESTQTLAK